jgi:hypothetical protein
MKLNEGSRKTHQNQSVSSKIEVMKSHRLGFFVSLELVCGLTACLQTPVPFTAFTIYPQNTRAVNLQIPAQASVQFIARDPADNAVAVTWAVKDGATYGSIDTNFSITTTQDGNPIKPGTYRVVACADINKSNGVCDSGDLMDSRKNLPYEVVLDGLSFTLGKLL